MTTADINQLYEYLLDVLHSRMDRAELNRFVTFCAVLLGKYLRKKHTTLVNRFIASGLTIKEIVNECLASFFKIDDNGQPDSVLRFLTLLNPDLGQIDKVHACIRFTAYLQKMADHYMLFMEHEYMPEEANIKRRIKFQVKSGSLFIIKNELYGHVLIPQNMDIKFELPPISYNQFEDLLAGKLSEQRTTPQLLNFLYHRLKEVDNIRRAVPLQFLVQALKNHKADTEYDDDCISGPSGSITLDADLEQALWAIDKQTTGIIIKNYLSKGMSLEHAESLKKSCLEIIEDMLKTAGNDNYYEYFARHSEINKDEFEANFRVKLDYLIKCARKLLFDHFLENNSENS